MSALDELRTYAEGDGAWAFEVKEVLARLDAAEEPLRKIAQFIDAGHDRIFLTDLHPVRYEVLHWMELAEQSRPCPSCGGTGEVQ